jgi:uncharacterized protein YdaU (DUF1376 family)
VSFAFLPFYTGDYRRDTQHLSMMEHGAYCLLLMHCWDQRGPLPLDERRIFGICNARSNEEMGAVRHVLAEFFTRMHDGWYNHRMDREINRAAALSERLSTAGKAGARKRKSLMRQGISTDAKPKLSQGSAKAKPLLHTPTTTTTLTTTPTTSEDLPTKATAPRSFQLPDWVPRDAWLGWEEMRRKIRKPLTDAARQVNLRKLAKLRDRGEDPAAVLEQSTGNAYAGLFEVRPDRSERRALSKTELAELFPANEEDDQTP